MHVHAMTAMLARALPHRPAVAGAESIPNTLAYGWRDYGDRVGDWRLFKLFDSPGILPSAIVNSEVRTENP